MTILLTAIRMRLGSIVTMNPRVSIGAGVLSVLIAGEIALVLFGPLV